MCISTLQWPQPDRRKNLYGKGKLYTPNKRGKSKTISKSGSTGRSFTNNRPLSLPEVPRSQVKGLLESLSDYRRKVFSRWTINTIPPLFRIWSATWRFTSNGKKRSPRLTVLVVNIWTLSFLSNPNTPGFPLLLTDMYREELVLLGETVYTCKWDVCTFRSYG